MTRCLSASILVSGMVLTATATGGGVARAARKGASEYYSQIVAGYDTLKKLEGEDWPKYKAKGDGDDVRRQLGTVGTKSPLFKLNKALAAVRDEVLENQDAFGGLDPLEFAEKAEAVTDGLEKADFLAYSAIFSGYGNGGGGTDFLEESHKAMGPTLEAYGEVIRMLKLDR